MEGSHLRRTMNQWANLPDEILFRITNYLDLKTDIPRVRGVCPSWRSSLPLADFPIRNSQVEVPSLTEGDNVPLLLYESRIYFFSPLPSADCTINNAWIARMVETGPNKWRLLNPVVNYRRSYLITDLPIKGEINLLDCRVIELAKPMALVRSSHSSTTTISKKVVGDWDSKSIHHYVVLALLEMGEGGDLLMLKSGDQKWNNIAGLSEDRGLLDMRYQVRDIAFHNGKFYFFQMMSRSDEWRLGIINPTDFSTSLQFKSGFTLVSEPDVYLVPSQLSDCVYLVSKGTKMPDQYDCYYIAQIDEDECERADWEFVNDLGVEILFIGYYTSFTLELSALICIPKWMSISMCKLSSENFVDYAEICLSRHSKVGECLKQVKCYLCAKYFKYYMMTDGALVCNDSSEYRREAYDKLFFPPPAWVKWCCPSLNNVQVRLDGLQCPAANIYDHGW